MIKSASVFWSPDGKWLAFSLAPGGGMNTQVYLIRPDGTDLLLLTAGARDNNWLSGWTHDSKQLIVGSNRRQADALDGCLLDIVSGELHIINQNDGVGGFTDISPTTSMASSTDNSIEATTTCI